MYYPVFRGKQYELLAIKELCTKLSRYRNVVPIIEPVKESERATNDLYRCFEQLDKEGVESIFITNPRCGGELDGNHRRLNEIIDVIKSNFPSVSFAHWVGEESLVDEINSFIDSLESRNFYLMHYSSYKFPNELSFLNQNSSFKGHILCRENLSRRYIGQFAQDVTLALDDPFNKQQTNAHYRNKTHEFFSDTYLTYREDGFAGFSDFLTIGQDYIAGGFTPYTVAVHLTYEDIDTHEIWIKHFLSTTAKVDPNTQEMIIEALEELKDFILEHPEILNYSSSCQELLDIYNEGKNTNLGYLKKLTLKHHLELMMSLV